MRIIEESKQQKQNYWWTEKLHELINEKKTLYRKCLVIGDLEDRKMYNRYKYMIKK